MSEGYLTLREAGESEFIIKKSRFIGHGSPARTEEEALSFLARVRARYKDASHNCYAYIIGKNAGVMRYSDDGEPGGTAGMPIIETMKARGVVDCVVVVTRYFGGVLLGAGGLARAYAQGAREALEASGVVRMERSVRLLAEVEYPLWGRVEHILKTLPVLREDAAFAAAVTATLMVRARDLEHVLAELARVTDGRAETLLTDELDFAWADQPQISI